MKAPGAFLRMRRLHVRCNDKSFKALDKLFAHLTASSFPAMHTLIIDITYAAWDGRGLVAVTAPIRELVINDDSVLSERYEHISHMSTLTRLHFKGEPFSRRRRAVRTVNLGGAVSKEGMSSSTQYGYLVRDGGLTGEMILPGNFTALTAGCLKTVEGYAGPVDCHGVGFCGKGTQSRRVTEGGPTFVRLGASPWVNLTFEG